MLVLTVHCCMLCLLPAALKAQDIESRYPFSATLRQDVCVCMCMFVYV